MKYLIQRLDTLFYQTSSLKKIGTSCKVRGIKHRFFKTIKSFTSFTRSLHHATLGHSLILLLLFITSCTNKPIVVEVVEPELFWLKKYGLYIHHQFIMNQVLKNSILLL